jgi:hypothetical protein
VNEYQKFKAESALEIATQGQDKSLAAVGRIGQIWPMRESTRTTSSGLAAPSYSTRKI